MKSSLARCADPKEHAHYCDVLVVGSGIAGLSAALEAADAGARVTMASLGPLCSGSSFFPGTWGLGMIGPVDESDESVFDKRFETQFAKNLIEMHGGTVEQLRRQNAVTLKILIPVK